jgi:circadian clock protein KaiC
MSQVWQDAVKETKARSTALTEEKGKSAPSRIITTGSAGLDRMLGGGVPLGSSVFICGAPGSGKTVLAQQMAYNVAATGGDVLYLYVSGFSESSVNRVKALQRFSFFDPSAYNIQVSYLDLEPAIKSQQMQDVAMYLNGLFARTSPKMIIVDSMKAVLDRIGHEAAAHSALLAITEYAVKNNKVSLLVGEYEIDDIARHQVFSVVDGVILLTAHYQSPDGKRYARIAKMRGCEHASEAEEFQISSAGLQVENN